MLMKKAAWIIVLALILLLSAHSSLADTVDSGTWGDGQFSWSLDDAGKLTISGSGAMIWSNCSWRGRYESEIITVEIKEGITGVGTEVFRGCSNLTDVTIPDSVTSIGFCILWMQQPDNR